MTEPYTDVQPIVSRAHWSAARGSLGSASASRTRSASTLATLGSARRSATTDEPAGTAMTAIPSGAIESTTSAPAAASTLDAI